MGVGSHPWTQPGVTQESKTEKKKEASRSEKAQAGPELCVGTLSHQTFTPHCRVFFPECGTREPDASLSIRVSWTMFWTFLFQVGILGPLDTPDEIQKSGLYSRPLACSLGQELIKLGHYLNTVYLAVDWPLTKHLAFESLHSGSWCHPSPLCSETELAKSRRAHAVPTGSWHSFSHPTWPVSHIQPCRIVSASDNLYYLPSSLTSLPLNLQLLVWNMFLTSSLTLELQLPHLLFYRWSLNQEGFMCLTQPIMCPHLSHQVPFEALMLFEMVWLMPALLHSSLSILLFSTRLRSLTVRPRYWSFSINM